jgi:drug/metabolite transporter (DMT)-like permease
LGLPVIYVLSAMVVFSSQDTLSKILVVDYSPFQIAWCRYAINLLILIPFLLRSRGKVLVSRLPWIQLARGFAVAGSAVVFMAGLGRMPIADATAIQFISPLLITAFSIPFLGERVGPSRWIAVIVGFIGIVIIVRPGSDAFQLGALLPLFSAVLWAIGMVLTRRIKNAESALTTLGISTLVAIAVLTAILPFVWSPLTVRAALLLLAMGLISILGQYLMILGYSRRPASVLAPLSYTQMVWSTISGLVIFGAIPGLSTWIGGAIVVASGLYVLRREQALTIVEGKA